MSPAEWDAIRLSVIIAVLASTLGLPIAIGLGYLFARSTFAGRRLLETLVSAPLVLPPVVTGYLLLVTFGIKGPIGGFLDRWLGVQIAFTWVAAVIAALVISMPLMVRATRTSFSALDPDIERAARGFGAGRWATFVQISLPLARRGVISGWLIGFSRSLGEFGATLMFAGNIRGETQTIPIALYSMGQAEGGFVGWRLVAVSLIVALIAVATSDWIERGRDGR